MKHVAIIGLGLMGGSLGLALKSRGFQGRITGSTRSPERRALAKRRGAVDEAFGEPGPAVAGADVVVYCAPILAIPELVRASGAHLKSGSVLTDVGSTKAYLVKELTPLAAKAGAVFVGSHPIAGSEQQGIESARPGLYEGAAVVVTSAADSPAGAVDVVESLWRQVGGVVHRLGAEEHDRIMAATSHFPHLAAALVAVTAGRGGRAAGLAAYCGPGIRDTTRIAAGSPEVWIDILATNRDRVLEELQTFKRETDSLIDTISRGDIEALQVFLERGRTLRRSLVDPHEKEL